MINSVCVCVCVCKGEGIRAGCTEVLLGLGYKQGCAGKYLTMGSLGKTKPLLVAFADFCAVNTPTNFKLPMWSQ